MRLALLTCFLFAAGCATARFQVVPDADWRSVPQAARDASDRAIATELTQAQHELQLATTALADARRAAARTAVAPHVPLGAAEGAAALDQDAQAAVHRVDDAKAAWLRTSLAWREDRVAAAQAHVEVVTAEREARRAELIDQHLPGSDSYDVETYRGQLARAQERYAASLDRAQRSRSELVRASADLASQKEALAQLVRDSMPEPDPAASLRLTGWTTTMPPGHHRRGLVIVSDSTTFLRRPAP